MKSLSVVFIIILCIAFVMCAHIYKINSLVDEINILADKVIEEYNNENWNGVLGYLDNIDEIWKKNRLWVCSTVSTEQIDEIEISLKQSREYASLSAKEDFMGEFGMFRLCIEHIIMQEGISLYELL